MMKKDLFVLLFLIAGTAFAEERAEVELISPIAKEREDGLDKLPDQVFTDETGVESWFIEEKGFRSQKIADKKDKKNLRKPANKKSKTKKRKPARSKIMRNKK